MGQDVDAASPGRRAIRWAGRDQVGVAAATHPCLLVVIVIKAAAALHEIGHLYLGNYRQAHSLNGVMNGTWSRHELDEADAEKLKFIGKQGARIRTAMIAALAQPYPSGLR